MARGTRQFSVFAKQKYGSQRVTVYRKADNYTISLESNHEGRHLTLSADQIEEFKRKLNDLTAVTLEPEGEVPEMHYARD